MTHTQAPSGIEWLSPDDTRDTEIEQTELVSTPERRLAIEGEDLVDADLDIEVTVSPTGEVVFRAGVWNLTDQTWATIQTGDRIDLTLGWADGGSRTICEGIITYRASYTRGSDTFYVMHGEDRGAYALSAKLANSWKNAAVGTIIHDIVDSLNGVSEGFIQTGTLETSGGDDGEPTVRREPVTLPGYVSIRRTKRVADWLDVLAEQAGRLAGTEYEWYVENGRLSFHPKQVLPDKRIVLSTDGSVTRLSSVSGISSQAGNVREFQFASLCHPELRKRARIELDMASGTRVCRLIAYTFRSGVTMGEHHCTGTLVEANASYPVGDSV